MGFVLSALLGGGAWLVFQRAGQESPNGGIGDDLRGQLAVQREELEMLRTLAGTAPNEASMARAAQGSLLAKIHELERENASLKEDIRLYERLVPLFGDKGQIRVDGFQVFSLGKGGYRYQLQALYIPGRVTDSFEGRLQLLIDYVVNGEERRLVLPDKDKDADGYRIDVRQVLRREGWFQLPDGAILKAVEGRLLQGGAVKARITAGL